MGRYKYHWVVMRHGIVYDYAQDTFMLQAIKHWLLEHRGIENYNTFTFKKVRISKEEWKRRYC